MHLAEMTLATWAAELTRTKARAEPEVMLSQSPARCEGRGLCNLGVCIEMM